MLLREKGLKFALRYMCKEQEYALRVGKGSLAYLVLSILFTVLQVKDMIKANTANSNM